MMIDPNPKDCTVKTVAYDIRWRRSVNTVNDRLGFCMVVEEVKIEVSVVPGKDAQEEKLNAMRAAAMYFSELYDILAKDPRRVRCERKGLEKSLHFSGDGEDKASDGILGDGAMLAFMPVEINAWPCDAPPSVEELLKNLSVDN